MIQTKERKRFEDLNLLDRFLFAEAMEDNQNMELLLDIILNQTTHLKQPTQTERSVDEQMKIVKSDWMSMQWMKKMLFMMQSPRRRIQKTFQREADYIRD